MDGRLWTDSDEHEAQYKWFDVERAMDAKLTSFGFTPMDGNELVSFLDGKSNVEVEAYFYTQKLAVSAAIEEIQGRGTEQERKGSRDAKVIGEFSAWVGSAKAEDPFQGHAETLLGGSFGGNLEARSMGIDLLQAGFGELGAMGTRPGGARLGFYVQLKHMGQHVAQADAAGVASANEVDPITNTINAFNPVAALATSYENVEVGSRVYGTNRGKLVGAQFLNVGKQALIAGGQVMMTAGNALIPGGAVAIGAAMIAAGNAIQVNPTTGESSFKMTDQAAIATATSIAGALIPGVGNVVAQAALQAGIGIINAGMEYDENGASKGWKMSGSKLSQKGIGVAVSAVGAGFGAELGGAMGGGMMADAVGSAVGSTLANNLYQHSKGNRQMVADAATVVSSWGSVANHYASSVKARDDFLAENPGQKYTYSGISQKFGVGERFVAGAVGSVAGAIAPYAKLGIAAYEAYSGTEILARPAEKSNDAEDKNKNNQSRRFTEIFQGYGAAREEQFGFGKNLLMHGAGALGIDTDRLGNWLLNEDKARGIKGSQWESTANLTSGRFRTELEGVQKELTAFMEGGKNINSRNGNAFVRGLRERAATLEMYGVDTAEIRASADQIERSLRAAAQKPTKTNTSPGGGQGEFRIIRDGLFNGGGGLLDRGLNYLGVDSDVRGALGKFYRGSELTQNIDKSATETYNNVKTAVSNAASNLRAQAEQISNAVGNLTTSIGNMDINGVTNAASQGFNAAGNMYLEPLKLMGAIHQQSQVLLSRTMEHSLNAATKGLRNLALDSYDENGDKVRGWVFGEWLDAANTWMEDAKETGQKFLANVAEKAYEISPYLGQAVEPLAMGASMQMGIWHGAGKLVTGLGEIIADPAGMAAAITGLGAKAYGYMGDVFEGKADVMGDLGRLGDWAGDKWNDFKEWGAQATTMGPEGIRARIQGADFVGQAIFEVASAVVPASKIGLLGKVANFTRGAATALRATRIGQAVGKFASGAARVARATMNTVRNGLGKARTAIGNGIETMRNKLSSLLPSKPVSLVDTNTPSYVAWAKRKLGMGDTPTAIEQKTLDAMAGYQMRATEKVVNELGNFPAQYADVGRDAIRQLDQIPSSQLERLTLSDAKEFVRATKRVGLDRANPDHRVLLEALSVRSGGGVNLLTTADQPFAKAMARMAGIEPGRTGGLLNYLQGQNTDRFLLQIGSRQLNIRPIL